MNTKSDPDAKNMACLLKARADSGMLLLRVGHDDFRGFNDHADAYRNIRDACDGKPALRYIPYTGCPKVTVTTFAGRSSCPG